MSGSGQRLQKIFEQIIVNQFESFLMQKKINFQII